jgi:hypothetical protein
MCSKRFCAVSALTLTALAGAAHAQCTPAQLVASPPGADDTFGKSIAIQGGLLAVGSPFAAIGANDNQGSVGVFTHVLGWHGTATLTAANGQTGATFGAAVATSGDWIVVGAPLTNVGSVGGQGRAYFFQRNGANWIEKSSISLDGPWNQAHAGQSVAIDGDYAIIGAPDCDSGTGTVNIGTTAIAVRVGDVWQHVAVFYAGPAHGNDAFGSAVGVRGDLFMAGVPGRSVDGHAGAGAVAITHPEPDGFWNQEQFLTATEPQDGAALGRAAVMGDGIIVAGAPKYDIGIVPDAGAVYIFTQNQFGVWVQTGMLSPPDPTPMANYGASIALHDNRLVVSELGTGKTYVYRKNTLGAWVQEWVLKDPEALGQGFGGAVAIDSDNVVVSSILGEVQGLNSAGYAHVFDLGAIDGADSYQFGKAVGPGTYTGCTTMATDDGSTTCGGSNATPDVWFRFVAPCSGPVTFDTVGSNFDTVLSLHSALPGNSNNTIACDDNIGPFITASSITVTMAAGELRHLRLSGSNGAAGTYTLNISACGPSSCYANCDASTANPILTANDFACFLNKYVAGDAYANCDNSTGTPSLTANDFQCFLNKYVVGCT